MSRNQLHNSGATSGHYANRFDDARLTEWLTLHIEGFAGPFTVERFKGGQSNPTYKLITPRRSYVLRRKPSGPLLKGAHAVEREAQVLTALEATGYPVAHVYGLCNDDSLIGTCFYVMDYVEGRIIWDVAFPDASCNERPAYYDAMNATIARLHTLDYKAIGLADYGRPGNYFERQIVRWTKQYMADTDAGRDANLDRLIEWLPDNIPAADETALVHGDFRVDNMIFHPTEPRILAVIDWELSTLGHPLADFAYHAMMYRMPPLIIAGLVGTDLRALNIPSEADYVAAYCRRTGRNDIPDFDLYIAFNMFRLAVIFHGIKGRIARGTAASTYARQMVEALPFIAERAWQQARTVVR